MSKMLMKWEDLLPGDVLELNPEFINFAEHNNIYKWYKNFIGRKLIIKKIEEVIDDINIYFGSSIY